MEQLYVLAFKAQLCRCISAVRYLFSIPNLNVRAVRTPGPRGFINKNAMLHLVSITQGIQTNGCGEIEFQNSPLTQQRAGHCWDWVPCCSLTCPCFVLPLPWRGQVHPWMTHCLERSTEHLLLIPVNPENSSPLHLCAECRLLNLRNKLVSMEPPSI